jgi:hypothetical protein
MLFNFPLVWASSFAPCLLSPRKSCEGGVEEGFGAGVHEGPRAGDQQGQEEFAASP